MKVRIKINGYDCDAIEIENIRKITYDKDYFGNFGVVNFRYFNCDGGTGIPLPRFEGPIEIEFVKEEA